MLHGVVTEAVGNLLASRQRSVLALIGILIGAGAVIAMLEIGAMAQNQTLKQFSSMGIDVVSIRSGSPDGMSLDSLKRLPAAVPDLAAAAPMTNATTTAVFDGKSANITVVGVTDSFAAVANIGVAEGRAISNFDKYELFCTIGSEVAAELSGLGTMPRPGSRLQLGRYVFEVVGVLAPVARNPMVPANLNSSVLVSIPNARRLSEIAAVSTALGRVRPNADPTRVATEIAALFERDAPGARVEVESAQALIAGRDSQMQLFQLLLAAVGGISLMLGGVGVMNIMLVSVQERRREIGIRLAIGARRRDIQLLFLAEAVVLAVLGAGLGVVLGLGASWAFARFSLWDFVVDPAAAPLGAFVSIAVGVFFGFYPAVMASRLDPIEALRSE